MFSLSRYFVELGPLRVVLVVVAASLLVLLPPAGTPAVLAGWALVPTVLVPSLVPIVFVLLIFDAVMSRVVNTGTEPADYARLRHILWTDLLLALALAFFGVPFLLALMR